MYACAKAFPSPLNPTTTMQYQIPFHNRVTRKVYNLLGQVAPTLVNQTQPAGHQQVTWDLSSFASGRYFHRLVSTSVANPEIINKNDMPRGVFRRHKLKRRVDYEIL